MCIRDSTDVGGRQVLKHSLLHLGARALESHLAVELTVVAGEHRDEHVRLRHFILADVDLVSAVGRDIQRFLLHAGLGGEHVLQRSVPGGQGLVQRLSLIHI